MLPPSWESVTLGQFVENEKGKKPKKQAIEKNAEYNLPYIDIEAFEEGNIKSWTNGEGCRICYESDFLMVWDGSRSGLVGKGMHGALGSTLVRINFPNMNNQYAYYFLLSKYQEINTRAKGSGTPHVDPDLLWNYEFPIAPLSEQKRIVAKIEELFSELDNGIASLKTAREQLKVYRQSVLKHAFEGKLTAKWREENADKLESPEQLLARIQQEREARYQEQLEDWKAAVNEWEANGKEGKKPGKPKKTKVLSGRLVDEIIIPNEWSFSIIGELNAEVFDGPFGSNLKSSDYVDRGVRVIRLENIGEMRFIEDKYSFITEEKYQTILKHTVSGGDIIFSSFMTEGIRVIILPESVDKAVNKADCFCVRMFGESYNPRFLVLYLSSRAAYKQIESEIHGIGRPRINTTQLKSFVVPICSIDEQIQILSEIEQQISEIDATESNIDAQIERAKTLRQSILKKAFSGQLVPQDPTDEPASELLARIQAEKGFVNTQKTKKTNKKQSVSGH